MASPILSTIGLIMDKLKEAWPEINWAFGKRGLAFQDAKEPFVVWAPSQGGDRFGPVDSYYLDSPSQPRSYRTILTRLEAHCRGGDFEITEALRHDLASILHIQTVGSYELIGGGWLEDGNNLISRTEVYVLLVDLHIPITDKLHGQPPFGSANLNAVEVTSELQFQSGNIVPDVNF